MQKILDPGLNTSKFFGYMYENSEQNAFLILDSEGFVLQINEAFESSFGYGDDDVIGKNFRIFFTEEDQKKNFPEIEVTRVIEHGSAKDNTYLVHRNGSLIWVAGESILAKNEEGKIYIVKVFHNIHERKMLERFLIESNDFVENILKGIQDVLVVVNSDMRILKANKAFFDLFGVKNGNAEGLNLSDFIDAFDINFELLMKIKETIQTGTNIVNNELELQTRDGVKRYFEINTTLLEQKEDGKRTLLVMHDKTMEKQSEQQREDVIGFISHELRNPLANLSLYTDFIKWHIENNKIVEAGEHLQRMKKNINRMNKIIHELYDATKAGSGNLVIEKTDFNFGEMIEESIETMRALYSSHKIEIEGNSDFIIHADRFRLIQVVTNYLSNAIKYSPGVDKVTIKIMRDENMVTTSVTDFGAGIPADKLSYIFNKFYRGEKTGKTEGMGLGLYLSREIIRAHHGNVWAQCTEGKGCTFYFSVSLR